MSHERNAGLHGSAKNCLLVWRHVSFPKKKNCDDPLMIKRSWLLVLREGIREQREVGFRWRTATKKKVKSAEYNDCLWEEGGEERWEKKKQWTIDEGKDKWRVTEGMRELHAKMVDWLLNGHGNYPSYCTWKGGGCVCIYGMFMKSTHCCLTHFYVQTWLNCRPFSRCYDVCRRYIHLNMTCILLVGAMK